jgi:hypothetical protein
MRAEDVRDVVRSYLILQVRAAAPAHGELLDQVLELYSLVEESALSGHHDARARLDQHRRHPLYRAVHLLLSGRARNVTEAAVELADDNRRVMARLESEVARRRVARRATAERLYRSILVEEVPLERSLRNVDAIVEALELLADLLGSKHLLIRTLPREAYHFVRRVLIHEESARVRLDTLWEQVRHDPEQLKRLAEDVRRHGPRLVRELYAAGESD